MNETIGRCFSLKKIRIIYQSNIFQINLFEYIYGKVATKSIRITTIKNFNFNFSFILSSEAPKIILPHSDFEKFSYLVAWSQMQGKHLLFY